MCECVCVRALCVPLCMHMTHLCVSLEAGQSAVALQPHRPHVPLVAEARRSYEVECVADKDGNNGDDDGKADD